MGHEIVSNADGPPPKAAWSLRPIERWRLASDMAVPLTEIRQALDAARIVTQYQPLVRIADGRPSGIEVLARLDHPERGTLGPDLFVPQVELAGLGFPLTQAVIRRAFADWGGEALTRLGLTLALNFPLDVLLVPDALAWLDAERRAAGIAPRSLVIELTESQPVSHLDDLRGIVAGLRRDGYGLAIDDVGPDLRDHEALLALDFTAIKLDKALVIGRDDDAPLQAFLRRAIAAGHAANLTVIAEGIEDVATWDRMAALGVDEAQGYLIARPMAAAAIGFWHRAWTAVHAPATFSRFPASRG